MPAWAWYLSRSASEGYCWCRVHRAREDGISPSIDSCNQPLVLVVYSQVSGIHTTPSSVNRWWLQQPLIPLLSLSLKRSEHSFGHVHSSPFATIRAPPAILLHLCISLRRLHACGSRSRCRWFGCSSPTAISRGSISSIDREA